MLRALFQTSDDRALIVLRVAVGVFLFAHGAQKLFGWFGGYGLEGTLGFFTSIGVPTAVGLLVIVGEFFGGLALIAGFLTRFSAAAAALIMLGAVTLGGHLQNGFFMNWSGQQGGEGFELHLLVVAIAIALVMKGAGALSVDRLIASRFTAGIEIPVRRLETDRKAA